MSKVHQPTARNTYRLIEVLPYPRAEKVGPLVDAGGTRLHGAYERKVSGGYRSALINNGFVLHRSTHPHPSPAAVPGARHSFANLVLVGGPPWQVPDASPRPITDFPVGEYPQAGWRPLWDSHFALQRVLVGIKPAATVDGGTAQVAAWREEAEAAGLVSTTVASWPLGDGQMHTVACIAALGPMLHGDERQMLEDSYRGVVPDDLLTSTLNELEGMTGEELIRRDLVNPDGTGDLIITGHAFGYPPMSTVAWLLGTNWWR